MAGNDPSCNITRDADRSVWRTTTLIEDERETRPMYYPGKREGESNKVMTEKKN
jgi:hypothetical protein